MSTCTPCFPSRSGLRFLLPSFLALTASVLLLACSSSEDKIVDGNADPHVATCDTRAVMACTSGGGACHRFFSKTAADAIRSACVDIGDSVTADCSSSYVACCIHLDGSRGYPEAVCVAAADVNPEKSNCDGSQDIWCGP